jgi:hypothetical protein
MIDYLDGLPHWHVLVSGLVILYFLQSYYRYCLAKGLPIDLYHGLLFMKLVFPMFIMSLFAYDIKNSLFIGNASVFLQPYLGEAFGATALGSVIVFAVSSRAMSDTFRLKLSFLTKQATLFSEIVRDPTITVFHGCVAIVGVGIVEAYLIAHFGASAFDLKTSALGAEEIRPLSNFFMMSYGPIVTCALLVCWLKFRVRSAMIVAFLLVALESVSGARGAMLGPVFTMGLVWAGRKKGQVKIATVVIGVALLGTAVIGVETAKGSSGGVTALDRILYGNDFSDVRDFAHILSKWNRQELYGKTYAAGFLGFVPRTLVPFRQEYSFATYANEIVGFKKDSHGGLRPGPFGEAYLNFGIPGVIVMGILQGLIFGFVRSRLDRLRAAGVYDIRILASQTAALYVLEAITVTSAVWAFYVFVVAGLGSIALRRFITPQPRQFPTRASDVNRFKVAATRA